MSVQIFTINDARHAARRRMPRIMFDFVDGATGDEYLSKQNIDELNQLRLQPRVLVNTSTRNLKKNLLNRQWGLPFGIAPMGMCDLTWPGADKLLAAAAVQYDIPLGISLMASSSIEDSFQRAGTNAWFQLYVSETEEIAFEMANRARIAGYDTLLFTVDTPVVAPRPREQRNGFQAPLKIGPRQIIDFALHPQWSIATLLSGVPTMANRTHGNKLLNRSQGRGEVDWSLLDRLRDLWPGKLIVKGVLSPDDAVRIRDSNADGIYVSNHGGRQLDSAPTSIQMLPLIRAAVGDDYPILFDSGVRNGEAIVKALALGADFVFLGRPFLYGLGADGKTGLAAVIELLTRQIDATLAQLGKTDINSLNSKVIIP